MKYSIIAETAIDTEDYEKCKLYKWTNRKDGQGNIRVLNKDVGQLSNFIMNFKSNRHIVVDHKDGNTLDNRKQNLQICTNQQNQWKKKIAKNNISGYKGLYWVSRDHKWAAQIRCHRKRYYLGYFLTKEEAALAYNKKAVELFGEFATLNQIGGVQ